MSPAASRADSLDRIRRAKGDTVFMGENMKFYQNPDGSTRKWVYPWEIKENCPLGYEDPDYIEWICLIRSSKRNGFKRDRKPWEYTKIGQMRKTNAYRRALYVLSEQIESTIESEPHFTWEEWNDLYNEFDGRCVKCGAYLPIEKMTDDHIVPVSAGGLNTIDNIQPMCLSCNCSKGCKTIDYRQDFFVRFPQYAKT